MWRSTVVHKIGLHRYSTYMLLGVVIVVALTALPTPTSYIVILGIVAPFLFITREVAHEEGVAAALEAVQHATPNDLKLPSIEGVISKAGLCRRCIVISLFVMVATVLFAILRVEWLGL